MYREIQFRARTVTSESDDDQTRRVFRNIANGFCGLPITDPTLIGDVMSTSEYETPWQIAFDDTALTGTNIAIGLKSPVSSFLANNKYLVLKKSANWVNTSSTGAVIVNAWNIQVPLAAETMAGLSPGSYAHPLQWYGYSGSSALPVNRIITIRIWTSPFYGFFTIALNDTGAASFPLGVSNSPHAALGVIETVPTYWQIAEPAAFPPVVALHGLGARLVVGRTADTLAPLLGTNVTSYMTCTSYPLYTLPGPGQRVLNLVDPVWYLGIFSHPPVTLGPSGAKGIYSTSTGNNIPGSDGIVNAADNKTYTLLFQGVSNMIAVVSG